MSTLGLISSAALGTGDREPSLLSRLASGVLPPGIERAGGITDSGATSFASLLARAREGGISSGRTVTIGSGVNVALSEVDAARVSAAADVLEASGATQALVVLNGQALKLDVSGRMVTEVIPTSDANVVTGIDAFIDLDNMGFGTPATALPAGRSGQDLLRALGLGRDEGARQAG